MAEQLGLNFGTGCTVIRQADGGVLVKPAQTREHEEAVAWMEEEMRKWKHDCGMRA